MHFKAIQSVTDCGDCSFQVGTYCRSSDCESLRENRLFARFFGVFAMFFCVLIVALSTGPRSFFDVRSRLIFLRFIFWIFVDAFSFRDAVNLQCVHLYLICDVFCDCDNDSVLLNDGK